MKKTPINDFAFLPYLCNVDKEQGVAQDTGLSKNSGFCQYPLWQFNEDFLREIGGANYEEYVRQFDAYMPFSDFEEDEEEDFTETAGMVME